MNTRRIFLVSILLLLLIPFTIVQGQGMDDDEERDLVNALVFMAAHNDAASGNLSADDLYAIRDYVGSYYDRNILYATQGGAPDLAAFWEGEKKTDLAKIKKASYRAWVDENGDWMRFLYDFFQSMTTPGGPKQPDPQLANTVALGARPASTADDDQKTQQNQTLLSSFTAQVQGDSYSRIITAAYISHDLVRQPDSAPVIQSAFSDLNLSALTDNLSIPTNLTSSDPVESDSQSPGLSLTPIRFDNNGSRAVTVKVGNYSGSEDSPPSASTVVFPENSTSAILELPAGEYQFCYEWDTGQDEDGDGYADLRHALTGTYILTETSSSSPQSSQLVNLDPDSASSSAGKCGQELPSTPPFEAAFQGEHRYWASVIENGCDAFEYETYPKYVVYSLDFSEDYSQAYYGNYSYDLVGAHIYQTIRPEDGRYLLLKFTESTYALSFYLTETDLNTGNDCLTFDYILEDE